MNTDHLHGDRLDSRFRIIYEHAPVMMHSIDKEGILRNVNLKWLAELGYERDDVLGKSVAAVMAPESARALTDILPRFWRDGKVSDLYYRYVKKDGTVIDALLDSIVIDDPMWGVVSLSVIRNITEQKKAEDALRRSEERFRAVFEGATDVIFIKDRLLRYTHVNPAMTRLFGLGLSDLIGRRAEDLFGQDQAAHLLESDLRVLSGESIEQELTLTVNQIPMTFHEVRVPLRDAEGTIIGMCGISRNISERKTSLRPYAVEPERYPSEAMADCLREARKAATTDSTVLLLGESGSGKDYLARWIHDRSKRAAGPYLSLNCAAISKELAESELFGHEPGAFTGARGRKRGLLELAEGGTLLLNEIGELPLALQSKLFTFLDTKSFMRVGGEKNIHVNARLIAATHQHLEAEVSQKRFLAPLFYRLNVFPIHVPPLRDRVHDIPVLVEQLMSRLAAEMQLNELPRVDDAVFQTLAGYHWPGNVRELRNVLERSLMVAEGGVLNVKLPPVGVTSDNSFTQLSLVPGKTLEDVTEEVTRKLCSEALRLCQTRAGAARMLGISRDSLYRYIKKFGLVERPSRERRARGNNFVNGKS
jgi:PAS domain S-box-containing protein